MNKCRNRNHPRVRCVYFTLSPLVARHSAVQPKHRRLSPTCCARIEMGDGKSELPILQPILHGT